MSYAAHFLLICSVLGLLLSISNQWDKFDCGVDERFAKYRVKENSILRKILPFKESENNLYVYFKIVPIIVHIIIAIATLVIYVIYWISPPIMEAFLTHTATYIVSGIIFFAPFILRIILYNL